MHDCVRCDIEVFKKECCLYEEINIIEEVPSSSCNILLGIDVQENRDRVRRIICKKPMCGRSERRCEGEIMKGEIVRKLGKRERKEMRVDGRVRKVRKMRLSQNLHTFSLSLDFDVNAVAMLHRKIF